MMKKILLFLLIAISSVVTSCESIGVDADAMPVTLEIFVKDAEGNNLMDYGWLDGTHDMNDEFVINWGDGTFDTIVIYNDCRTTMNGGYDIKRHYVVNGVKTENHRITLIKETI